jgi:predicted DNA-binding transcriptional regulator AlpA
MISFEQTQLDVAEIKKSFLRLESLLKSKANPQTEIEVPINIKGVSILTELSVPTLYSYAQRNKIPYYKKGNRLKFFKSEIIDWIKEGKVKSFAEIEANASTYLSNKNKGLK